MGNKMLYAGECRGGPMTGHEAVSRYPEGFVLVDKPGERVWIYDHGEDGFTAREVRPLDWERLERAAAEPHYDVRAYEDGGGSV